MRLCHCAGVQARERRTSVAATAPEPTTPPARSSRSVNPAMWLPERVLIGRAGASADEGASVTAWACGTVPVSVDGDVAVG